MDRNLKYDVFISYRRNGGSERAELLKLILEKYGYDHNRIFMDTHSIESCNFKQKIKEAIFFAKDFILIISKGCFDCIKEEDYWIFEIKEALTLGKRIIPIFFDGIESINSNKLPKDLSVLLEINGIVYHPQYADAFYLKLLSFINPSIHSIKKKQRNKQYLWLVFVCLAIVTSAILVLLCFPSSIVKPYAIQQDYINLQESDSIKTMSTPYIRKEEDIWVVNDIKNSGQSLEKRFSNRDFMDIVHYIVSQGIANGDITSFSKTRPFPPISLEHRNEIWCLYYPGKQSETIVHTTFQRLLGSYMRERYQYEDNNKNIKK